MSSRKKDKYSFPSGKFFLKFKTAIVTGVGRSGKTALGNILATNSNVEFYEEPWILNLLPAMTKLKMIDDEVGKDMFVTYLHELMNDMVLLRQANFRPNDDSSIWTKKTHTEIFSRIVKLQSRTDVKNFVKKNKPLFLMILREAPLLNLPAVFDALPDCKIIHVIRRGIDVAYQIGEKGWLSNKQLIKPPHARIYYSTIHNGKLFYVPCWIDTKDKKKFVEYSEYERSLLYWCSLVEKWIKSFEKSDRKKQVMTVKFEDFIENPRGFVEKSNLFLNTKPSSITRTALQKVQNYDKVYGKAPKLPKELLVRTKKIYKYFGYAWN